MSHVLKIVGAICLLPYAYAGYFWFLCSDCNVTGHSWFYTFALLLAAPFLLAFFGGAAAIGSARAIRDHVAEKRPAKAVGSSLWLWITLGLAVPSGLTAYKLVALVADQPEEGRDRLGRICTKEGNVTHCRPDPDRQDYTMEQLNQMNRKQRGI